MFYFRVLKLRGLLPACGIRSFFENQVVGFSSWWKHRTCINIRLSLSLGWADRRLDPLNISRVDVCLVKLVNLRELGWRHWFSRSLSWVQTRVLSGDMGACPFFFFLAGISPAFHFPVFLETVPPNKARSIGYSTWPTLTGSGSVFDVPRRAWQRPGRVPGPWRLADSPSSGSLCHEGNQAVRSKGREAAGTERVWVLSYSVIQDTGTVK